MVFGIQLRGKKGMAPTRSKSGMGLRKLRAREQAKETNQARQPESPNAKKPKMTWLRSNSAQSKDTFSPSPIVIQSKKMKQPFRSLRRNRPVGKPGAVVSNVVFKPLKSVFGIFGKKN